MLKHLGRPIQSYHFSNTVHEKDHAFSGNPTPDNRTFSLDTQRQILGQHGLGDFRKPSIQIQHGATEGDGFPLCPEPISTLAGVEASALLEPSLSRSGWTPWPWSLKMIKQPCVWPSITAYEDRATITGFSKIENCSDETVVIHKTL